jgi:CBS domain-containing protein
MIELEKAGLDRFQRVISIATLSPVFCNENEKITEAIDKIIRVEHEKLPVVTKKNQLVGLIGLMDILDAFLRKENLSEKISKIMVRDIIFCNADDTLDFVLQKIKLSRKGMLPVVSKEKLVGVVSECDFVKHFSETKFEITVGEAMTKKPFFISPNISILDGLKSSVNTKYRRLPVVQNKKLSGLFAAVDVLRLIKNNSDLSQQVDSMMVKNVFTITKDKDLSDAIKIMKSKNVDGLPVVDNENHLEGIITERDILEQIV